MGDMRNAHKILVLNLKRRDPLEDLGIEEYITGLGVREIR
jgi:hypothetical protein